jgi:hypothetical protein
MVDSSKILTVSYGTFSCTLEGFDDSFGTMKAIAEYFRDLAADDRYFGAEPPAPDVQMLAKIAEREITRRVDASTTDGGIVLRAQQAPAPAMPPQIVRPDPIQVAAASVAPQVAAEPAYMADMDQEFETAHSDATASEMELVAGPEAEETVSSPLVVSGQATPVQADTTPEHTPHPDAQSVAAKLQRIRAVVGHSDAPEAAEYNEDQHVPEMPNIADVDMMDIDISDDVIVENDLDDVAEPMLQIADEVETLETFVDVPEAAPIDAIEGNDAQLDSATAEMAEAAPIVEDVIEDVQEPVIDAVEEVAADVDITIVDAPEPLDAAIDMSETAPVDVAEDDDALLDSLTAKMAETAPVAAEPIDEPVEAIADDAITPDEAKPTLRTQILRLRKSDQPVKETAEATADSFAFAEDDLDDLDDLDDSYEEDVLDVAKLDGFDELDAVATPSETSLSADEEADLMDELAEVERDFSQEEAPADEAPEQVTPVAKVRSSLPDTDDSTLSHILDQTDQELSEPAGSRRRNAIAQLKAAVAATEAARQLGDDADPATEVEDAFRGDLDEVVRPRRPPRVEKPVERTARPRPAPLKLVASQRVNAPDAAPTSDLAVAPRRVAAPIEQVSIASASNFAEFAENMGATALPDLLEAAAAYTAFVEGSEDFSRPQIMKKVQLTSDVEFTREDGLRSFGTLLREGRISKVRNGRFQVSDETRFRPETKVG